MLPVQEVLVSLTFYLSNLPHFHSAYLLAVCRQMSITVYKNFFQLVSYLYFTRLYGQNRNGFEVNRMS